MYTLIPNAIRSAVIIGLTWEVTFFLFFSLFTQSGRIIQSNAYFLLYNSQVTKIVKEKTYTSFMFILSFVRARKD